METLTSTSHFSAPLSETISSMEFATQEMTKKPLALIGAVVVLSVLYLIWDAVYNLYISPLRHVPGPKINAISRIPYVRHLLAGTVVQNVTALHEKYDDVVRFSPNELSLCNGATSWPEIYGFRTGKLKGVPSTQKDIAYFGEPSNGVPSILAADNEVHSRGRKALSHGFSEKVLATQEELLQSYVDQLVDRLREVTSANMNPKPVDFVKWMNWATFDIIAGLLFREPFGCLQDLSTHKYVELLFQSVKFTPVQYMIAYWPWVRYLGGLLVDQHLVTEHAAFSNWTIEQTHKRWNRETERPDLITYIKKHNAGKKELSMKEVESNSSLILIAGSETTATLLSGVTYALLKNPDVLQKLTTEIRNFQSYDDITLEAVNRSPYLLAVLNEGLRYFPPIPTGNNRVVAPSGQVISGYFIPGNTSVCVSSFPTHHTSRNFRDPKTFAPERWMGNPYYANDKRDAFQPFSFGPRACLGKSLAYAEMRLILAKLVYSFDLTLNSKSKDWMADCRLFSLSEKPELLVHFKDAVK